VLTRVFVCSVVLLALADGCGEESSGEEGGGAPAPAPRAAPRTITEADRGKSFTLSPGSETSLRLSGDYVWSEPTVSGAAVQLTRVDYFRDPGFSEWMVRAVQAGKATIESRGTCAGQERCPDDPIRFRVQITVDR
jgi:predicted secreted protein